MHFMRSTPTGSASASATVRVTGLRLDREPGAVVDSVRRHLARRGAAALD